MKFAKEFAPKSLSILFLTAVLLLIVFINQPVLAATDYLFFSINGDTTLTSMTQGDELGWGSNCDSGATINWVIYYDANTNSIIDPGTDALLTSENITDGSAVTEADPIPDGWSLSGTFNLAAEPGNYIFRAKDIVSGDSVLKVLTMVAMSSPPNQLNGQIILPGITPPNSILANRTVFAESDTGDEGTFLGITDNMGQYSINIGPGGTGVEFYLDADNVPNYAAPSYISAIASGIVNGNDITYSNPADSIWGFIKDETDTELSFETSVGAQSGSVEKYSTTTNSRYVIYFSSAEKGNWRLQFDSRVSPAFLNPQQLQFSHDTLGSFQHDITVTTADAFIYARITENGGLPVNNYRVDAMSTALNSSGESISGVGADNIARIGVSTLDNSGWEVYLATWGDDFPIPAGLVPSPGFVSNVSPGDTVTINLINGYEISGSLTQDPGDGEIVWDDIYIGAGIGGTNADAGAYSFYTSAGMQTLGIYADNYISNPAWRDINVVGDITSGVDFEVNETHCLVSGTISGVSLPLDASWYTVTARTDSDHSDGYYQTANIDSTDGTYSMRLCDGDWTISPPDFLGGIASPGAANVVIGESPDNSRTQDFEYVSISVTCGDVNDDGPVNIGDIVYLVNYIFKSGPAPTPLLCIGRANFDSPVNIGDVTYLVNYVFKSGPAPNSGCCD